MNIYHDLEKEIIKRNHLMKFVDSLKTYIYCYASGMCLGAVLTQLQTDNSKRVVQYVSPILNQIEQRYSNTERELLAIVWSVVKKFCFYTESCLVTVYTDHKALLGKNKLLAGSTRLIKMWMKLQHFTRDIVHKSGSQMVIADSLSRYVAAPAMISNEQLIDETHQ
jgi:RNase H-like domain found in reverse transcriptase